MSRELTKEATTIRQCTTREDRPQAVTWETPEEYVPGKVQELMQELLKEVFDGAVYVNGIRATSHRGSPPDLRLRAY